MNNQFNDFIKVIKVTNGAGGGPFTVTPDSPTSGDYTITDTTSTNSFIIPKPVANALSTDSGDTSVTILEGTSPNSGDELLFTLDGVVVGKAEKLLGGTTKWTFDGILDPIIFRPTKQTTAELVTLVAGAVKGDIAYDSDLDYWVQFNGTIWEEFISVSTTVSANSQVEVTAGTVVANKYIQPDTLKVELDKKINTADIQDDDTLVSASATDVASSESIKAYVDSQTTTVVDDLTTGGTTDALSAEQGKHLEDNKIETSVIIDEDDMVSNDDTKLPTQQSVKAYVDSLTHLDDDVEGITGNLVDNTDARNPIVNAAISTDAEQLLKLGTDSLPMLDSDDLISVDANNGITKGTDGKLYFNPNEQDVVADIAARDALTDLVSGKLAYVVDASADADVDAGAALYVYDGAAWQRIAEFESMDFSIGAIDSDSGLSLVTDDLGKVSQDAVKTVVLSAAPVDGVTVAYYVGQLFWDNVNKKLYEATAKSTNPDAIGVGSTFSVIEFGADKATFAITVSTGSAITPDFTSNQEFVIFIDGTSTGDVNISNATATVEHGEKIRFVVANTDTIARNIIFGGEYLDSTGATGVDTIVLGANSNYRIFEFVRIGTSSLALVLDTSVEVTGGLVTESEASTATTLTVNTIQPFQGAGTYTLTLPAATGVSGQVYLANSDNDSTGAVTLAVQSGESLNGTVNGTLQLIGASEQWVVTDVGTGEWVIREDLTASGELSYLHAYPTGTLNNFGVGLTTTTVTSIGSNITNNGDGTFTLAGGNTYKLKLHAFTNNILNEPFWWTEGENGTQVGTAGNAVTVNQGATRQNTPAIAIVSPTVDTIYGLDNTNGNLVLFGGTTNSGSSSIIIEQLPTSSVVMPDALEVTDLNRIQVSLTATVNNAATTHYAFDETLFTQGSDISLSGTGSIQGLQAGKTYRLSTHLQLDSPSAGDSDASTFRFVDLTGNAQIGEVIDIHPSDAEFDQSSMHSQTSFFTPTVTSEVGIDFVAGTIGELGSRSTFTVEEVAGKTVINTNDIAVDDQATSGYMDIGTMRMQWGTVAASTGGGNPDTVTFPAAFADANYSFTATAISGATDQARNVSIRDNTTATSIEVEVYNPTNHGASTAGFHWQAIGLRP